MASMASAASCSEASGATVSTCAGHDIADLHARIMRDPPVGCGQRDAGTTTRVCERTCGAKRPQPRMAWNSGVSTAAGESSS